MSPKTKLRILFLGCVFMLGAGLRCNCTSQEAQQRLQPVVLNYWRVFDTSYDIASVITDYTLLHPNVNVRTTNLRYEEFEDKLRDAYAEQNPPDIISLHYGMLPYYVNKKFISPMPESIKMVFQTKNTSIGIKQEVVTEVRTTPGMTLTDLKNTFLDTVSETAVVDGKIYGLPLSVDTMVLYYNRDLLDQARIPVPPTTWQELQDAVKKTTFIDNEGKIVQSGVALGTAENIRRGTDILMLLMKQNGADIIKDGQVQFTKRVSNTYNPGLEALRFYTDFANPRKEVYSWDASKQDALRDFAEQKSAFYFGYSYDLPQIRAYSKNAINLGITKMPQIGDGREVNIASYWIETVSSRTKNPNEAWDFLMFVTKKEEAEKFLKATKHPTALRSLIDAQLKDEDLNIFASQLLTAFTWYKGYDYQRAEDSIQSMISEFLAGKDPLQTMNIGAGKLQQTLYPPR